MQIIPTTITLLEDALLFLAKVSPISYTTSIAPLFNSTLGRHTRHFIELYQCLLFQPNIGVVNYDARQRSVGIETDKNEAIQVIKAIQQQLLTLDSSTPLLIETDLCPDEKVSSSLLRELLFNYDHCVHHLALIRVGLHFVQPNIDLPERFGMAVSTINHQQFISRHRD